MIIEAIFILLPFIVGIALAYSSKGLTDNKQIIKK